MKIYLRIHRTWEESKGCPYTTLYDPASQRVIHLYNETVRCEEKVHKKSIEFLTEGATTIEVSADTFSRVFTKMNEFGVYESERYRLGQLSKEASLMALHTADEMAGVTQSKIGGKRQKWQKK